MNDESAIGSRDVELWKWTFTQNVKEEEAAFRQLPREKLVLYKGQFVAVSGGQIIDKDRDEFILARRVSSLPKDKFILIEQV